MESSSPNPNRHADRMQAFLGTAGILFGAALVCLGFVAEMDGPLPFFMPRSWYVNRPLWYFLALVFTVGGGFLLRQRQPSFEGWESARPGLRFHRLVLYSRDRCQLCDEALQTLRRYDDYLPDPLVVNIDTDRELIRRFGTCVPVVEIDGKVRFRGRLSEVLLRRLIEGTEPLEAES